MSEPLSYVPDLTGVETSRAVPIGGTYIVTLSKVELVFSQNDQAKPMFKLTWTLDGNAQRYTEDGNPNETISPGYQIFDNVLLHQPEQKPGKNASPDYKVRVAQISDALNKTKPETRGPGAGNLLAFVGQKCAITTKVEKSDEFGLQCRITKYAEAPAGA